MELAWRKPILFIILLIVVVYVGYNSTNLFRSTTSNLNQINERSCDLNADLTKNNYYNCDINNDCTDDEKKKWDKAKEYLGNLDCSNSNNDNSCSCIQNIIWNLKNPNIDNVVGSSNVKDCSVSVCSKNEKQVYTNEIKKAKSSVNNFLSSNFYKSHKNKFEAYAKDKNIDVGVLYAIIIKEGGYDKSFKNTVRFECHKFNAKSSEKVPCTIGDGGFSRVKSETNYNAYLRAKKINPKLAFESSSFGFAQIMGFNYNNMGLSIGYDKGLVDLSFDKEFNYFTKFLETRGIITDIKNKNWVKIAEKYNGGNYKANNYDLALNSNYNDLKVELA